MSAKRVLILMGSDSDLAVMEEVAQALTLLHVRYEMHVASAHRTPEKVIWLAREARQQGFGVIVAGAGFAAHLAGVVAAHSLLPVIGVPLSTGPFNGADSLLSTVQMPRGFPVATVGVGPSGSFNAGLLAATILAVEDDELTGRIAAYRDELARKVEEKDTALQRRE
jgi:phosphoribosylaminoimidazole carboxylase PurE protein